MIPVRIGYNIARWYQTVRHLKWQQIIYRLWYPLKRSWYRDQEAGTATVAAALDFPQLAFPVWPGQQGIYHPASRSFQLLNIRHVFSAAIDWDMDAYGLLWTYHLNYFDWLNDPDLSVTDRLATVWEYLEAEPGIRIGRQSYPSSLRITNWIRFVSSCGIREERIVSSLYRQSMRLFHFPEYHIQGNHLLENGITLIWISAFFNMGYSRGLAIAAREIRNQILPDGAHCERSIMYHAALLRRILDLLVLRKERKIYFPDNVYKLMSTKASCMLSWLRMMQFSSGAYPCFGDCTPEDCPDSTQLTAVARDLIDTAQVLPLKESGYRRQFSGDFELLFNCGKISPGFQPGHAHADLFSFCLEYKGCPVIVDTGVSTYEAGRRREYERATLAHNTVCVGDADSSDVWRSFRVGRRATPELSEDTAHRIVVSHDGYLRRFGLRHQRCIDSNEGRISIEDRLIGNTQTGAVSYLHFPPGLEPEPDGKGGFRLEFLQLTIRFEGIDAVAETYEYCAGFNKRISAKRIRGVLRGGLGRTIFEPDG